MNKFNKEESQRITTLHMEMLKRTLKGTGTAIGFNKTNHTTIFFNGNLYSNERKYLKN